MRWILALAAVALAPRPADACSCAAPLGPVSPADGETGLPTNAALLIDTSLEAVTSVTLTAPGGAQVALIPETHGGFLIERPAAPLQPNTTYTVTTTRATAITSTFTTGAASDSTPPSFPGASSVTLAVMGAVTNPGTACANCAVRYAPDGSTSRIHFMFPNPPPDAVLLWVELSIPGDEHPLIDAAFSPSQWDRTIDFHAACQVSAPQLTIGNTYCAQVLALDAAGNSAGSAEACATAYECAPAFDTATCEPSPTCTPVLPGDTITTNHGGGCASAPGAAPFLIVLALAFLRRRS